MAEPPSAPVNAQPSAGRSGLKWACRAAAFALIAGHFIFLMAYFQPAIATPDANGYYAQATRIADEGRTWFVPDSPLEYVGTHWLKTPNGRYYSRYPAGFPLILSIPFKLGGPAAAMLLNPLMCSLTLLALYLVCSIWIGRGWALLATALMACNPVLNEWALGYFAHTAAAFFLVWGIYCLARWEKTFSIFWALAAGLLFGIIPSVRYAEILFCGAAAAFVIVTAWGRREARRSVLAGALGVTLPVAALLVYDHFAFGAFWRTGYALTNEQTGFSLDYFLRHAVSYIEGLSGGGAGLVFAVGLAGIASLCARRETWRKGLLLAALVAPVTLLYMAYYWGAGGRGGMGGAGMTMRFMVPTFYVYAIAGVWLLSLLGRVQMKAAVAAGLALLAVNASWGVPASVTAVARLEKPAEALADITRALVKNVEPGSLLIAGNSIQQHLDFVGKWRLVDETAMSEGRQGRQGRMGGRRFGAADGEPSPMQPEKLQDRLKRYEGLTGMDRTREFIMDLWNWAGDKGKVYWLADESAVKAFEDSLPEDWPDRFKVVATVQLPKEDAPATPDGAFGGPPQGRMGPAYGSGGAGFPGRGRMGGRTGGGGAMGMGGMMGGRQLLSGGKLVLVEWTTQ